MKYQGNPGQMYLPKTSVGKLELGIPLMLCKGLSSIVLDTDQKQFNEGKQLGMGN